MAQNMHSCFDFKLTASPLYVYLLFRPGFWVLENNNRLILNVEIKRSWLKVIIGPKNTDVLTQFFPNLSRFYFKNGTCNWFVRFFKSKKKPGRHFFSIKYHAAMPLIMWNFQWFLSPIRSVEISKFPAWFLIFQHLTFQDYTFYRHRR